MKRRNRPWLLLVLWPLLCGIWLSAAHDPDACLPAATQLLGVENLSDVDSHNHDEHDHHSNDAEGSELQRREHEASSTSNPQLEVAHPHTHDECASCSLISASASVYVVCDVSSSVIRVTRRWTLPENTSFRQRHARGFSTRGPPSVFA